MRSDVRELIRASGRSGGAAPMRWRVERGGQRARARGHADGRRRRTSSASAASRLYPGQPPEMVTVRYGVARRPRARRVADLGDVGADAEDARQDADRRGLAEEPQRAADDRRLRGPVGRASASPTTSASWRVVSVSLGVLNLLPLPMLDGGHLMYYLFEGVTGRPVSELWLDRLQRGGVAIMLMMMSLALYNDVARLLGLH